MTVPVHHQDTGDHHFGLIAATAIVAVLLAVASLTILQVSFDGGGGTSTEPRTQTPSVVETASATETFSPEKARAARYAPTTPVTTGNGHPDIRTATPTEAVQQGGGGHPDIRTATPQAVTVRPPTIAELEAIQTQPRSAAVDPYIRSAAGEQSVTNDLPLTLAEELQAISQQRQGGGHPDIRTASAVENPNAGSNVQ